MVEHMGQSRDKLFKTARNYFFPLFLFRFSLHHFFLHQSVLVPQMFNAGTLRINSQIGLRY
jgi:hypothetical protein